MKFTIVSHAGLYVEHNGVSILFDPWLEGSCYWRSWWNFPAPDSALLDTLRPDFIYITHLHWDHFHGVSLRRFDPKTRFLVPKIMTKRMRVDLNWLGFNDVTEISHGGQVRLGDDFDLHSFQFGPSADSAAILTGGGYSLFNCNDCKYLGLPLNQILGRFGKFDFVFRSHSSASAVPYCIENYESDFPALRRQDDYVEEFSRFTIQIGARYAIPFASNHCFLHRETLKFNETGVVAPQVAERCNALALELGADTKCVVMPPGSSWSAKSGFEIRPFDYDRKDDYVDGMLERHADVLDAQYQKEASELADFTAFESYFTKFLKAVPWILRVARPLRVLFKTTDADGTHRWIVDLRSKRISVLKEDDPDAILIEVHPLVLNDCVRQTMFSVWTASKRLKIILPKPSQLRDLKLFFLLLDLYELEGIPLRKLLRPRSLGIVYRRWREVLEAGRFFVRHRVIGRPVNAENLYPRRIRGAPDPR